MLRYETLILAHTQITADELSMLENHFEQMASDGKGKVLSFDKWGKYRLAYPVKKNDYGVYILARYEMPDGSTTSSSKNLTDFFKVKCNEIVMRHVTIKLDDDAPLNYARPEPVDGARSGNLDTFLKENKMESFLGDVKGSEKKKETEEKVEQVKEVVVSEEEKTAPVQKDDSVETEDKQD